MKGWWLPLTHARLWLCLSLAMVAGVVIGSLMPGPLTIPVAVGDKLEHATTYFLLCTWFVGLAPRRNYPWIASGLLMFGLSLELMQHFLTAHRVADPLDMAANSVGVAAGIVAAHIGLGEWAQRLESWLAQR